MGAVAAAAIATGIFSLFGGQHPDALTDNLARGSWLAGAGFPGPAVIASAAAVVTAKGSRKFAAVAADGRRLFVKALGSDQRDADLLYRAYRAVRLRNVGDTRPAASLFHAVEHQALVGVMAERAGVFAPGVDRVVRAGDTALLAMEWVDGSSLEQVQVTDDLLVRLWAQVDKLHRAGIAHRSRRTRSAAAAASGRDAQDLARLQRVRPRTLLAIAAAAGVYYYILPELAGIGSSWRSLQSAHWIWLPVVIAFSVLTYLASAISLQGSVTIWLPFWPTVLTQGASSFVNRVRRPTSAAWRLTSATCRSRASSRPPAWPPSGSTRWPEQWPMPSCW